MLVLRRFGVLFAGLLLLLVGGIVLVTGVVRYMEPSAGFGWTAYPDESTTVYAPGMAQIVAGFVLMVLGLMAAVVWFVLWLRRERTA